LTTPCEIAEILDALDGVTNLRFVVHADLQALEEDMRRVVAQPGTDW
jgi:hypothetical protein